jgi:predicted  nucleic acid-binding Zn-ribbon protein
LITIAISQQLFELQEIDNHLMRLNRERAALDDGEKARAAKETLAAALREQEEQLNQLNAARISAEEDLAARESKLNTQQQRLMNAKSTHEVQSLERDIKALTAARGELDEKVLLLMDEIEQCTTKLDDLRAQHQEQEELLNQIESAFAAESARIDTERETLQSQRETAFAALSAVEQTKYENAASRHNGIAVAHLHDGACSACGTALTPFNLKEAKTEEWPTCESCRRFLYVKE